MIYNTSHNTDHKPCQLTLYVLNYSLPMLLLFLLEPGAEAATDSSQTSGRPSGISCNSQQHRIDRRRELGKSSFNGGQKIRALGAR